LSTDRNEVDKEEPNQLDYDGEDKHRARGRARRENRRNDTIIIISEYS
jgi:hypothetical protein